MKIPKNPNYAAIVVKIGNIIPLENCDNVVATMIMGNQVIVSKDTKINDIGLFFPVECELSKAYLSNNNLYRHSELNVNKDKKGYFEDNGRIRCVKFRGHNSEGLFMPIQSLDFITTTYPHVGQSFDELNDIEICKKYEITRRVVGGNNVRKIDKKYKSKLVENQFRLHDDTEQLYRNLYKLYPDQLISITYKLHGTSFISSKVLCKKPLKWYENVLKSLGVNVVDTQYDYLYASRKVIKNAELNSGNSHFYGEDIWGLADAKVREFLQDGMTIYGEIVGYLPSGGAIQKDYDYGCAPNTFEVYIYRITYTNTSGKVFEFSAKQVQDWCKANRLDAVPQLYYGYASELYTLLTGLDVEDDLDDWRVNFLKALKKQYNEEDCFMCTNKVPQEGVVLRIEKNKFEAYKIKSVSFLERESSLLDKGEIDIESES